MVDVSVEHKDNVMILRISGTMSFADIIVISKTYIPQSTCHIVFNMNDTIMDESITFEKLCNLQYFVKDNKSLRDPSGKSAHINQNMATFGMLNMVTKAIESCGIPHRQRVFKSVAEAFDWLAEE